MVHEHDHECRCGHHHHDEDTEHLHIFRTVVNHTAGGFYYVIA